MTGPPDVPPILAQGRDLRGDYPILPPPSNAAEEALAAIARGETRYVEGAGISPLREAIAAQLGHLGLDTSPDQVIITSGEQEARYLALQTLEGAGYRLLVPSVAHPGVPRAAYGLNRVVTLPMGPGLAAPSPEALRREMRVDLPSALYLESPTRLIGARVPTELVEEMASALVARNGILVWDASLAPWLPTDQPPFPAGLPRGKISLIALGGVGAGMSGGLWTLGFLALPSVLVPLARRLKQIVLLCTTVPMQWGALEVLRGGAWPRPQDLSRLQKVWAAAAAAWPEGVLPGDALTMVAFRAPAGAEGVPVLGMPGEAFGAPGVLRLAVTLNGEIVEGARYLGRGIGGPLAG